MNYPSPDEFVRDLDLHSPSANLQRLVALLRGPEGCPWDQKQTALSMIDYVIDEAHELKQAITDGESEEIKDELGDLKFTLTFLEETLKKQAPIEKAADSVIKKMISRHPHVFDRENFETEADIRRNWEAEKRKERDQKSQSPRRLDGDISASLPPMRRATKVLSRAMGSGFAFPSPEAAWGQCCQEFEELDEAARSGDAEDLNEELGDMLLSLLAFAKMKSVDPAACLRDSEKKLCDRIETMVEQAGNSLEEIPSQELAERYRQAKSGAIANGPAYLNFCGVGLWPDPVRAAVRRAGSGIGRTGLPTVLRLREEREALRERLKAFAKAPNAQVHFVPNVSQAALGVAYAQNWSPGDKLVVGRTEFPANTVPWKVAAETFSLELLAFDEDLFRRHPEKAWQQFESLLQTHRPRIVAFSAVSFWSGFRLSLPRLASLCQNHGARLFIDAIQAMGTVPVEMTEGIDYLACGSHKGLMTPEGAGFLLVDEETGKDWVPRLASWLSLPDPVAFLTEGRLDSIRECLQPRMGDPSALEMGSVNTLGYCGLAAAVEYLENVGVERIFSSIQGHHDVLEQEMNRRGWQSLRAEREENRSAILSFRPPSMEVLLSVMERFQRDGISAGMPTGHLRFGFHYQNSSQDIVSVLDSIDRTTKLA